MGWRTFQCMDCDINSRNSRNSPKYHRRLFGDESSFETYGDYTYMFNEYELDFDEDNDWNTVSRDGHLKCSIAVPGLEHKLCVDTRHHYGDHNKGAKISFAAADDEDIDYGYYDMY